MKLLLSSVSLLVVVLTGYTQHPNGNNTDKKNRIILEEVIQVSNYTYLSAKVDNEIQWFAVPTVDAKVGEAYFYKDGMAMGDFRSPELDRTFKSIIFLGTITRESNLEEKKETVKTQHSTIEKAKEDNLVVEVIEGGISIKELFANKEKYAGKIVKIKGKVTKFNPEILYNNWIHIQDGTDNNGEFDLTVTTKEVVEIGDVVTLEGKITLDKDFGFGYFFKVIMEEAVLK